MILADETAPLSRASKLAASAECAKPRSSACRMSSLEPAGYPSRSATVLAWAGSVDARKTNIADHRASRMEAPNRERIYDESRNASSSAVVWQTRNWPVPSESAKRSGLSVAGEVASRSASLPTELNTAAVLRRAGTQHGRIR